MAMQEEFERNVLNPAKKVLNDFQVANKEGDGIIPGDSMDEQFSKKMRRFATLELLRRELETSISSLKSEAGKLSVELLEEMATNGCQQMKIDNLSIFPKTNRYVSKKKEYDAVQMVQLLKEAGLSDLVSTGYNAMRLKSKICEWMDNDVEIPGTLLNALNIGETHVLTSRKA